MKQFFCLILLAYLTVLCACKNEKRDTIPKVKQLPTFEALELDSVTIYSTEHLGIDSPTIIIYFDPDCHTCQDETKMITKYIDDLKHTQILMLSIAGTTDTKKFVTEYDLQYYKNIKVVKDKNFSLYNVFKLQEVPSAVLYTKNKQLAKIFQRAPTHNEIVEILKL
ncbi:hypothetical protein WJU16_03090 [Chitinophaga pollutisoli]|uniref:AhpC/TSA family protein n=1 Tax=Chitinophaga pollutisoli TaxID=3133966 RepID=A0ABZ2YQG8_9BACT